MTLPVFVVDPARLEVAFTQWDAASPANPTLELDGPEGRHAAGVRRLRAGERLIVTDGAGRGATCAVLATTKTSLTLELTSRLEQAAPSPRVIAIQAIPKADRGELAVELLTEVGVDVIVPWAAERCVAVWRGERAAKGVGRWRATAREAAKQARRLWHPEVTELHTTHGLAAMLQHAQLIGVLHEQAEQFLTDLEIPSSGDVVIIVGPEGGISPQELAQFGHHGGVSVRLGPTVLRTSTAGAIAAGHALARTSRWYERPMPD